jgi:DNA ligase-1
MQQLQILHDTITQCADISGHNERCAMFKKIAEPIKDLIAQIYDPFQKFHVTSANILKFEKSSNESGIAGRKPENLSELLQMLSEGSVSGHLALQTCLNFIQTFPDYRDTIFRALNKDLKIRVGVSMVNKAFPFLVPAFSCALSHPMEKHLKYYEQHKNEWMISRKLDGCRCIFVCDGVKPIAYSRSGHIYPEHIPGLDYFLEKFQNVKGVLDGEMTVMTDDGKEFFNIANSLMNPNATKERNKKNLQMKPDQYLCYFAFDLIPLATFKKGEGAPAWESRQVNLKTSLNPIESKQIRILPQEPATKMDELWQQVEEKGYEGLMLRLPSAKYEGKKTRNMLKRKAYSEEEFTIEDATTSMQMQPGDSTLVNALEHIGVTYKENRVWVYSGLTWEEKVKYGKDPKQLVGKMITVKFNGESKDKDGKYSLRHPVVKAIWDAKKGRDR